MPVCPRPRPRPGRGLSQNSELRSRLNPSFKTAAQFPALPMNTVLPVARRGTNESPQAPALPLLNVRTAVLPPAHQNVTPGLLGRGDRKPSLPPALGEVPLWKARGGSYYGTHRPQLILQATLMVTKTPCPPGHFRTHVGTAPYFIHVNHTRPLAEGS